MEELNNQNMNGHQSSSTVPNLELAQLFIQANKLISEEQYAQARELLHIILSDGDAAQKEIAKNAILKLEDVPSPSDALAATSIKLGQFSAVEHALQESSQQSLSAIEQRQGVCVGALNFMMNYADGTELTDVPRLYHVPNSPSWLLGTVNLHGVVLPVFDLVGYFSINRVDAKKKMLLVLTKDGESIGIVVDGLPQRLRFDISTQQAEHALATNNVRPYVKAAVMIDDVLWFDLDIPELFNALEQAI